MRGSCHGVTEGASWAKAALAPSGPLGHLPRIAGEDLEARSHPTFTNPSTRRVKPSGFSVFSSAGSSASGKFW